MTPLDIVESSKQLGGHKMLAHLDRMADWQHGLKPPPVTVELDLTNLCNHACPDCTFSYLVNISKDSIPFELAQSIVDQLGAFGVRGLTFSGGGEPLVYGEERVLALMKRAVDLGMDTALITNGSLLRSEEFLNLCQWVRVSLDAYDEITFERFHGRKSKEFDKIVGNFRDLCKWALALKLSKIKCATVGAGFLTTPESLHNDDFARMAEFCAGFPGLDYLQFRPLVANMVADPSLTGGYKDFDFHSFQICYEDSKARFERDDFKILWSGDKYAALAQPQFGRTYHRCLGHFLEATISADCKVYLCCHTQGQERFCLGDLRTTSFADIWSSERVKQVYESFDPQTTCPPACRLHPQNVFLQQIADGYTHPNFI